MTLIDYWQKEGKNQIARAIYFVYLYISTLVEVLRNQIVFKNDLTTYNWVVDLLFIES